jgi:YggT family protein
MIHAVLQIFIYILIADVILSWLPDVRKQPWAQKLHEFANIPQKPIRDLFPKDIPIDPAPMILIILCQILMQLF